MASTPADLPAADPAAVADRLSRLAHSFRVLGQTGVGDDLAAAVDLFRALTAARDAGDPTGAATVAVVTADAGALLLTRSPDRAGGRVTIGATGLAVETITELLAAGEDPNRIRDVYPQLTPGGLSVLDQLHADLGPDPETGFCRYGAPVEGKPGIVGFCPNHAHHGAFNWPLPGGRAVRVPVCDEHSAVLAELAPAVDDPALRRGDTVTVHLQTGGPEQRIPGRVLALGNLAGPLVVAAGDHHQAPAPDAAVPHIYLSTGCRHDQHDYCQSMTGTQGEKRPATCKFCDAKCVCPCHDSDPPTPAK